MNLPSAWIECDNGVCPDAAKPQKNKGKDTYTLGQAQKPQKKCDAPCACRLFSAPKDDKAGDETWSWEVNPNNVYNADEKQFKWICTKPNIKLSGETVCEKGTCQSIPSDDGENVTCVSSKTNPCEDPCRCKLFQLEFGLDHEAKRKAEWEQVSHPQKKRDSYTYLCLCLQPKKDD
jgi:hypothetical protein